MLNVHIAPHFGFRYLIDNRTYLGVVMKFSVQLAQHACQQVKFIAIFLYAGIVSVCLYCDCAYAEKAYEINGKVTTTRELIEKQRDKFYRLENEKYQLIDGLAKEAYLEDYFSKMGAEQKLSSEAARDGYLRKNVTISQTEIQRTLAEFKDHPKLKKLPKKEQENQIRSLLKVRGEQELLQEILAEAEKTGKLKMLYPRPSEPVYELPVNKDDHIRYVADDQKASAPAGCSDDCAVTIIEYSEFQCPFCARMVPTAKRLLEEYKGKIRWIVRDFPLDFHDRARPAAIAAKCAGFQNKYWNMYEILFANQTKLSDKDLSSYAEKIKLDKKKYDSCVASPDKANKLIDRNMKSGVSVDVAGTPAVFFNGRRQSGAISYEVGKRLIDEELAKIAESKKPSSNKKKT